jgi:hypothetical protein
MLPDLSGRNQVFNFHNHTKIIMYCNNLNNFAQILEHPCLDAYCVLQSRTVKNGCNGIHKLYIIKIL